MSQRGPAPRPERSSTAPRPERSVAVAYALFVLVGLSTGANGVLILAQMTDYGVGRAMIGITLIMSSAGFAVAGATTGPLIHRWGTRTVLLGGGVAFLAASLVTATRPAFWVLVGVQALVGYGVGLLESVLNAHIAAQTGAPTLLNRLHAFFGVGALLGPLVAASMLRVTDWPMVILAVGLVSVPMLVAVRLHYPGRATDPLAAVAPSTSGSRAAGEPPARLLPAVLRQPGVLLGAALLSVYVGLEIGVGTWGYGFLVETRGASDLAAGWTMSAYWLGLTLGRFVLSPLATRIGVTAVGLAYGSLFGVAAASAFAWLVPTAGAAVVGFVLLGFFLGPIFPTTLAIAPDLTQARLAPTAIGVMNGGSVVGGAALPWLAGALGQGIGVWTLLPFTVLLAVVQLLVWWRVVAHLDPSAAAVRVTGRAG